MHPPDCQSAWSDEMIFVTSLHVCTMNVNQVVVKDYKSGLDENGCNRQLGDVLICNDVQVRHFLTQSIQLL